jgi:hypothetical protein
LKQRYPGIIFIDRTKPGQTGVDLEIHPDSRTPANIARVGFERAEIKPLSESDYRTYGCQVDNWGYKPEQVKPITYDARGNYYFGFGLIRRKK